MMDRKAARDDQVLESTVQQHGHLWQSNEEAKSLQTVAGGVSIVTVWTRCVHLRMSQTISHTHSLGRSTGSGVEKCRR